MLDYIGPNFADLFMRNINNKNQIFKLYGHDTLDAKSILAEYIEYANILKPFVVDTVNLVHEWINMDEKVICEGAQATLLDVDFESYPFVTSFNPTIGGILTGSGLNPKNIDNIYGVLKAYSSRVGEGPYITEQNNEIGNQIRELGHEYGTTTKRPRRCGWLDLVALKYAVLLNGITGLAINHLDTIGKLSCFKVCVAYEYKGVRSMSHSLNPEYLKDCIPVYEEFIGDFGDISKIKNRDDLPSNAKIYLNRIEELVGTPIKFIGTGPGRDHIIIC